MTVKFTNNASSTLASGINTTATSLTVADASTFPSLSGADDYCYLTIQQATGTVREVVKATARSGNNFTIQRAFDNTTAQAFSASDIVELRMTAALLQDVIDQATVEGIKTNYQFVPTAGQTQFSGADNSGDTLVINDAELVNVYMNGVRLVQGSDYTVSSSNNRVTLTTGATTADIIDIEVFGNFTGQSGAAVGITGGAISGTAITTGSINNTPIGATQANTVAATLLTANSATFSGTISSGAITATGTSTFATSVSAGTTSNTDTLHLYKFQADHGIRIQGSSSNWYIYNEYSDGGKLHITDNTSQDTITVDTAGNTTISGTISSGDITVNENINSSTGHPLVLTGDGGANIELYSNGNAYFDATQLHLRGTNGSGGGALAIAGTTVIDSSRNLTNIGTISSGAITSSGGSSGRYVGLDIINTTSAGGTEVAIGLGVANSANTACDVHLVADRVAANAGSDFYIEQSDASGNAQETFRITEAGNAILPGNLTVNGSVILSGTSKINTSGQGGTDYLEFDDDTGTYASSTNATVLSSKSDLVLRTNANDGGGGRFRVVTGASSPTTLFEINNTTGGVTFANGNVMVGKTSSSFTTAGVELAQGGTPGKVQLMRASGALTVVNTTNDGNAISIYKGTAPVGSIGSDGGDMYLGTGITGVIFNDANNTILPYRTNAEDDGNIGIGLSNFRFKDLYLAGKAQADTYQFAQNSAASGATESIHRNTTSQITIRAGSDDLVRVDGANDTVLLGGMPAGSVMTHGVIATNRAKASLGLNLGDTMRVFAVHGQTANSDFLTFGSRRITQGQSGWNHAVWDISRDVDNTSNLYRYMTFGIGETVINDHGDTTMNFRVETSSNEFALKTHASSGSITIGQNTPSTAADGWYWGGLHSTHRHLVGTHTHATNANALLYLNRHNASGGVQIEFRTNNSPVGTISTTSSGTFYATTSDRRLKEDIAPISGATALLEKMNPVSFKWIEQENGNYEFGFIAQEMTEVMPEAVVGNEDELTDADGPDGEGKPVYMQMDYGRITPIIVAALQEANKEIAALKARIQALEEEA